MGALAAGESGFGEAFEDDVFEAVLVAVVALDRLVAIRFGLPMGGGLWYN